MWELADLRGHTELLSDVAFHPDGHILASSSWDHTIRLWDAVSASNLSILEGHDGWVFDIEILEDLLDGRQAVAEYLADPDVALDAEEVFGRLDH